MTGTAVVPSRVRSSANVEALVQAFLHHLKYTQGKDWDSATLHDHFTSLALAVRDCIVDRMIATQTTYNAQRVKRAYYLSLEWLLGQQLRAHLVNLGLLEDCAAALSRLGVHLDELCDYEPDAGLGNGGLGRLAACYIESAATLQLPFYGYGIRYEYGIFDQRIEDGWQVEHPDDWLRLGSPWEIPRPELSTSVRLYGRVEDRWDADGRYRPIWREARTVIGMPYDIPVVAYRANTVNLLRLWSARASESFDLAAFNRGGYIEAMRERAVTETISKVLYPDDRHEQGRELRLLQQYFFVACTLADILRRHEKTGDAVESLPERAAIQLNDTHPALGIAELMRILVDERGMRWERAWDLCRAVFSYTNHTLLPEALELWPVRLIERVLPRHMQILYEINRRHLLEVARRWPDDPQRQERLSLIHENAEKSVRMAHLAITGSHHVNGVAELHTQLIRTRLVPDFAELWPERFSNRTNGVTPRRWVASCNPELSALITSRIGGDWVRDLDQLRRLEPLAGDADFRHEVRQVKLRCKQRLAQWVTRRMGVWVDPEAIFDVHVKRLHEYKRQLLNILHVIARYRRLKDDPAADLPARLFIFGAKAAPGYTRAKLIIKLINEVARVVNDDPRTRNRLRVLFVPNYRVSVAERIIPAADLSEQISTAGMEASGTGNMKFALNGALTLGTLDGANIQIRDAVGADNFFLFGLTADQVAERRGRHDPWEVYHRNPHVRAALEAVRTGEFSPRDPGLFAPVFDWLMYDGDPYMLLADIESYLEAHARVDALWRDPHEWARRSILNVARVGYFSSDRAVREYASDIWNISPRPIVLPSELQP